MIDFLKRHKRWVIGVIVFGCLIFALLVFNYLYIGSYSKYVTTPAALQNKHIKVGIVFGSGISKDGKPYSELRGRLDGAANALRAGTVNELLLSGDNRFAHYDEPGAMLKYLVEVQHIDITKLHPDYAGRSTYETCERAKKIFSVDQAVLFSAPSHLPRAIFTCRKFGVESYGIPAGKDANNASRREFLARSKAMFNIYIYGEDTILGPTIPL